MWSNSASQLSTNQAVELLLALRRDSSRPLHAQLAASLRDAVRGGALRPGDRLPPSRALARDLGVSRGLVVEAYGQLVAEGYLVARTGSGTSVAAAGPVPSPAPGAAARTGGDGARLDFLPGVPDTAAFPRTAWAGAVAQAVRRAPASSLLYGDPRGAAELRVALAAYLARVRGVVAAADDIVICAGVSQALNVLGALRSRLGLAPLGIEDPSHPGPRALLAAGLDRALPIPVDDHGIDVDRLEALHLRSLLLTPAHQYPLGAVLGPDRRLRIAAWARRVDALIVEDDYDAEFRYDREPVGALQGLDPGRVVYTGSVSKTLAPAIRLGWMVVPRHLVDRVAELKQASDLGSPVLDQLALAHLLATGAYERHVRRMRAAYRSRRDALVAAVDRHLPGCGLRGIAAGMHAVLALPPGTDEGRLVREAARRGVTVRALSDFTIAAPRPPGLVMGYGRLGERAIAAGVERLAAALRAG
jgi:GntR family transcriptional regulator/MocR family aminotransferase